MFVEQHYVTKKCVAQEKIFRLAIGTKVVNRFHSACVPTVQGQHDPVKLIKIGSKIMQYGYKNSLNLYQMWNVNYIDQNCPDDF